ncbi:MAG TPA: prolyl oligopeptidase family serine peptidase [Nocardioidaceae bacterium]|nr:prolyl oligopeptidase family serine peptidase [Nocardioidaceae bacterium]
MSPPVAARREVRRELHGHSRTDAYAWLRDVTDPEVLASLAAERAYYDAATAHLDPLIKTLSAEMTSRVPATDSSVSYRRVNFSYYTLTPSGSEYAQLCRRVYQPGTDGDGIGTGWRILLDPAELTATSEHVDIGVRSISPDEKMLAYSVDLTGDEVYALRFRETDTGIDLTDVIPRTYYGGAWSADSSTFFYTVHDEAYRPYQVRRHLLGTAAAADTVVLTEPDERFEVTLRGCRSGDVIEIVTASRDTSEVWLVDAHSPELPPRRVEPRRLGIEYRCEHVRTAAGDRLLIVTNDGAQEFRLMSAPLADPGRDSWTELVGEDRDERLYSVTAFAGHVVTTLRRDGALMARAYRLTGSGDLQVPGVDIRAAIPGGTLELDDNEYFPATSVHVVEQSYTEPPAEYDVDLDTGGRTLLRRREVPNYEPSDYVSERVLVPAEGSRRDGKRAGSASLVEVPVTVVRRKDTPLDGSAACLLYGYGAYEASFEPEFDAALPSLLDRGVVYAHAHVRGGGEGGRRWWLDGRLERKQNTFSDHIAVADALGAGLVDRARIVTRGLSAGGLLQGAVFSQAPDRWAGVIAEVPFVDVVTTMLDPSVPLTANEWDEWGDPRRPEDYAWLLAYSPYDNLPAPEDRADLLVTGAVHDPRVMVSEPAKWVAALRHTAPQWSPRCLFRVELGAGAHAGPSGRFARLRYEAEIQAWALERLGAPQGS